MALSVQVYFRGFGEEVPEEFNSNDDASGREQHLSKNVEIVREKLKGVIDGFENKIDDGDVASRRKTEKLLDDLDDNISKNLGFIREEGGNIVDEGKKAIVENVKNVNADDIAKNVKFATEKVEEFVEEGKKRLKKK